MHSVVTGRTVIHLQWYLSACLHYLPLLPILLNFSLPQLPIIALVLLHFPNSICHLSGPLLVRKPSATWALLCGDHFQTIFVYLKT